EKDRINDLRISALLTGRMVSKDSTKFFDELAKIIPDIKYGKNEIRFKNKSNKLYYVDCFYNNKVIEFNGDFYHANPRDYHADDILSMPGSRKIKASDIWEHDNQRKEFLENTYNLKIKVIWASECKMAKERMIKEC